jgi:hypothetical protein
MVFGSRFLVLGVLAALWGSVAADDVLSTTRFTDCGNGTQAVDVNQFYLQFDRKSKNLTFQVAGLSKISANVTGNSGVKGLAHGSTNQCRSSR